MSRVTHQRGYEKVVVVVDHPDLVGVHEDPLDLLEGAVEYDVKLLRVGRVLDLLQHRTVVVAERIQLVQGEFDALVALGELEHLLESDQRLLVFVYHHERLPVKGLEEARICLKDAGCTATVATHSLTSLANTKHNYTYLSQDGGVWPYVYGEGPVLGGVVPPRLHMRYVKGIGDRLNVVGRRVGLGAEHRHQALLHHVAHCKTERNLN